MMKKTLATLVLCLPLATLAQDYTYSTNPATGNISVSGEATVYVVPDTIKVNFGIETRDMDLAASQAANRAILKRALESFRHLGVEDKDIKTDYLSVEPRYEWRNSENVFTGYFSRNGFVVTLKDKAQLERVVDAALAAGVNYVHGVEFETSELRKYRDQARQEAITAAREKAEALTAALGSRLGPPTRINANDGNRWWFYCDADWGRSGGRNLAMTQNSIQSVTASGAGVPGDIQLGKIAVRASVDVSFSLVTVPEDGR
ncbi:SIMPL domain-containing protein [Ruficoccus amylovorans]|uniref:SIMPL domain-containing protein n=1 Tax=Ruficoccus amylovorans TaxID=1804625 RepID=A0A842HBV7_9BACT|nr:SIMPL domain-containing protein [Ruficoccus amylovorans]MBC2593935.1 SIMPL domain-containing protein [Ruficoccus amylovorans]